MATRRGAWYCTAVEKKKDSHFPGCGLDFHLVWRDELRLELPAPLDGALDALARLVEFPLGSTQVPRDRVRPVEPAALPRRIRIVVWKVQRVGILQTQEREKKEGQVSGSKVNMDSPATKAYLAQGLQLLLLPLVVLVHWLHDCAGRGVREHLGGFGHMKERKGNTVICDLRRWTIKIENMSWRACPPGRVGSFRGGRLDITLSRLTKNHRSRLSPSRDLRLLIK